MKIKTFQAMTMQEALNAIKAELGPDAVILSTKSLAPGKTRFGLLGRPLVEVTAAVDRHTKPLTTASRPRAVGTATTPSTVAPVRFTDVLKSSLQTTSVPSHASAGGESDRAERHVELGPVLEELKSIRECLRASLPPSRESRGGADECEPYLDGLRRGGLEPATVALLVKEAQEAHGASRPLTVTALRRLLRQAISRRVRTSGPLLQLGDKKKTVILVGPTGVGKTTTAAKLAAQYKLTEGRRVALMTLDTYRVAAVEQLRTYATLIGVPMDIALTRRDALESIERRQDAELTLIDTAGRSPRDAASLAELNQLIDLGHPVEVHLVLSATTRDRDLLDNMQHYQALPISRLLFTKLDETTCWGGIFELMHRTGLPLSYLTRGQRVPEDLEIATPEAVATLLTGDQPSETTFEPLVRTK